MDRRATGLAGRARTGSHLHVPEAEPAPAAPTVIEERSPAWFERREAPFIVGLAVLALIALLFVLLATTSTRGGG